jgi:hypothetical protein
MASIKLPHFGTLDSESLEEYSDVDIEFNGSEVQIDLNFENDSIAIERLELTKRFIENLRIHDLNNKKYIINDLNDAGSDNVRFYLQHHLEELATDDLADLIGDDVKTEDKAKLLMNKLHLVRVGLYPDSEDQFAIFDYSIGKELTNYLVVINTDENGNLDYMTVES